MWRCSCALLLVACTSAPEQPEPGAPACDPGQLASNDGCVDAGVPLGGCAPGFESDGRSGCTAVMTAEACAPGWMALPGDASCRELQPCGSAPWGDIPIEPNTQHVDIAYAGIDSDGSAARPWKLIQDAVDAAAPGAIVAIAAGSYPGNVQTFGKPVRLWGRCPTMVEIVGASLAAVAIVDAPGSEVHALAVTGDSMGIAGSGGDFLVDRVWLHDLNYRGVYPNADYGGGHATIRDALIERAVHLGIFVKGYGATIERTVVRDTQPIPDTQREGRGINVEDHPEMALRSNVTVSASLVEHNRTLGIFFAGSDGVVHGTLVRDTQPRVSDATNGRGVGIEDNVATGQRSNVTVRGVVLERNHDIALYVSGADAVAERVTIRDTRPRASNGWFGGGVSVERAFDSFERASLVLVESSIEASNEVGMLVFDGDARIERTAIVDTKPREEGTYGDGLSIVADAEPASVEVWASRIQGSARAGVGTFGASVRLETSLIACNLVDLTGEPYRMGSFVFEDGGGNGCGCPGGGSCKAVSSGLAPPSPLQ